MAVVRYDFGGLVFSMTYDFGRLERNFCKVAGIYQGQPRILTILKENEGVTLSELSPLCNIGMPSLSVSLRNLQKSGLVRKDGTGKNQKLYLTAGKRPCCFTNKLTNFMPIFWRSWALRPLSSSMTPCRPLTTISRNLMRSLSRTMAGKNNDWRPMFGRIA